MVAVEVIDLSCYLVLEDGLKVPVTPARLTFSRSKSIVIETAPWESDRDCKVVAVEVNGYDVFVVVETLHKGDTYSVRIEMGLSIPAYDLPPKAERLVLP